MAIRNVYNFEKDPYYADLYGAPTLANKIVDSFNQFQQMEGRQLQNRIAERRLQQEERQLDAADSLSGLYESGTLNSREDIYAAMERAALESGDVQGYLKTVQARDAEKKSQEQEAWQTFTRLKQTSPVLAEQFYNENFASKYGAIQPGAFEEKPKIRLEDGQVFFVDENKMTVTPGQRYAPSSRGGSGDKEPKFDPGYYVSPDGTDVKYFNEKDPSTMPEIAKLMSQGYRKPTAKKEEGGSLIDVLKEDAPVPNASPAPVPSQKLVIPPQTQVRKRVF